MKILYLLVTLLLLPQALYAYNIDFEEPKTNANNRVYPGQQYVLGEYKFTPVSGIMVKLDAANDVNQALMSFGSGAMTMMGMDSNPILMLNRVDGGKFDLNSFSLHTTHIREGYMFGYFSSYDANGGQLSRQFLPMTRTNEWVPFSLGDGYKGIYGFAFEYANYYEIDNINVSTPAATPLPAAVWLLGSGLVGLAGLRKKFKT